jgi:hypothetical protein
MEKDKDGDAPKQDVLLLHSPTEDGEGIRVLRAREDRLETGEVRAMKEGQPLMAGEIVKLAPRPDAPRVCDVQVVQKVEAPAPEGRASTKPVQVATRAYRESWDRIFGADEKTLN